MPARWWNDGNFHHFWIGAECDFGGSVLMDSQLPLFFGFYSQRAEISPCFGRMLILNRSASADPRSAFRSKLEIIFWVLYSYIAVFSVRGLHGFEAYQYVDMFL
jgi:hypothetical protein